MAEKPLTNSINALIAYINEITGETDTNLSDAISTLAEGYGGGGYNIDDIASGTEPSGDLIVNSDKITDYFAIGNRKITSVYAPYAKSIGISGFNTATNLITAIFPLCETVGNGAFQSCSKLQTIEMPLLTKVSPTLFMSCVALTKIDLPLVKSIENQGFRACVNLTRLSLPSCESISGVNVFTSDTKLTDIYLPNAASSYTGAPWGAPNANIHYNTRFDEDGEPVIE